jgi:hypothetical protein
MGRLGGEWVDRSRFISRCALALAVFGGLIPFDDRVEAESRSAFAAIDVINEPLTFGQISGDGFGNCLNSYSWSMAWFKEHLYVGTNKGSFLQGIQFIDPDFDCVGNGPGEDPAAEIWRYSPLTKTWDLVFRSPTDVPVWGQPDVFTARDNGFRDMIVFTEPDGTEALYVAGLIYGNLFETRLPRILRSTDGVNFEAIPQDPGTVLGSVTGTSFRALASYEGRLYVTIGSIIGEGIILEAENPKSGNDNFRQVSPPGMLGFELIPFNGYLYVGTGEATFLKGFDVLKTDATPNGTPYYDFVPVVTNGGDGPYFLGPNNAVLSMKVFQGRLYVGGQTDLIRINPDDTWELVVGTPRTTPQGEIVPLSGLPQGFGNWFTGHLWRMEQHEDSLYVGTWDFSGFLRILPLIGPWIDLESGFDLWKTEDGVSWSQITRNGLASKFNHGVRSLQSTPDGLFLGTANPWDGTEVYMGQSSALAAPFTGATPRTSAALGARPSSALMPAPLAPPHRLEGESQGGGSVLSWEPSPQAVQFQILRATHLPNRELGVRELPGEAWVAGPYTPIGTTTEPFYRDSTVVDGHRYTYYVQARGKRGQISEPSNVVMAPSFAPAVTFDQVRATVRDLARRGKIKSARTQAQFSKYLAAARSAAERGQWGRARSSLEALHRKIKQAPRRQLDPLAAEDLEMMVARLLRRVTLAQSGVIPGWELMVEPE